MSLISVVVPIYNSEKYLDGCVQSILDQTFSDLELILVDDGSTDHSLAMCRTWAKKDNRVRVIHKENGGAGSARNAGIAAAIGQWISFVDSDDWIEPNMLESLYALGIEHGADVVKSKLAEGKKAGYRDHTVGCYHTEIWDRSGALNHFFRVHGENDTHYVVAALIRRNLFENWKFLEKKMNEDVHACYCLAINSKKTVYTERAFYHYRRNMESVTLCKFTYKKMDLLYMWDVVTTMVKQHSPEYIYACEMNRKRAYMTLLIKMRIDGYDRKDAKMRELKRYLKRKTRKSYRDLMRWNMPISRKIALTIAIL